MIKANICLNKEIKIKQFAAIILIFQTEKNGNNKSMTDIRILKAIN